LAKMATVAAGLVVASVASGALLRSLAGVGGASRRT